MGTLRQSRSVEKIFITNDGYGLNLARNFLLQTVDIIKKACYNEFSYVKVRKLCNLKCLHFLSPDVKFHHNDRLWGEECSVVVGIYVGREKKQLFQVLEFSTFT